MYFHAQNIKGLHHYHAFYQAIHMLIFHEVGHFLSLRNMYSQEISLFFPGESSQSIIHFLDSYSCVNLEYSINQTYEISTHFVHLPFLS